MKENILNLCTRSLTLLTLFIFVLSTSCEKDWTGDMDNMNPEEIKEEIERGFKRKNVEAYDISDDEISRFFDTDTSYMQHSIEEDTLRLLYYENETLIKQFNFAYNRIARFGFLYSPIPDSYLFQLTYE